MNEEPLQSEVLPEGRWLPLNSRRVTTAYLQLVAQSLGLPTGMSAEELRQQVEGKLLTMEHEPHNVQVVVQERSRVELHLLLVDEAGVFVESEPVIQDGDPQQESAVKEMRETAGTDAAAEQGAGGTIGGQLQAVGEPEQGAADGERAGVTAGAGAGHRETESSGGGVATGERTGDDRRS